MIKIITTLFLSSIILLMGCNGSSGENDENLPPADPSAITITLLNSENNSQLSFDENDIITVKALVKDENGQIISGQLVNFSAGIGTLTPSSKLTDNQGYATVTIANEEGLIGGGTAIATISDLSANIDYEYTRNTTITPLPVITNQLLLNGVSVTQFNADQQVKVTTSITNENGQAINGVIVNYTADIGTLSAESALTSNGMATVTLSSDDSNIGAGVITATLTLDDESQVIHRMNYQIKPSDTPVIDTEIRLGYFDDNNEFVEGKVKFSIDNNTISAGGTLGLTVALVDSTNTLINTPVEVSFTSNCVLNEQANIDASAFSIKGYANATFEDINCAGTSGTEDVIIASITIDGITNTATETLIITGEELGSIEFISAEPTSIVLKGTGGQETSTLVFKVKSALGNVLSQQSVNFTLNTTVGGINLSRKSGITNSQGLVSTQVSSGTVPTPVRVTAKANMTFNNNEISVQTQSDLLSINTGLPEQRSLTIAAMPLNPEANYNGETSTINVWLADNFNNPVPDGTTVNFTTEGGTIEPSCSTTNGNCSVTWTSTQPRVDNHRITILATALGHETFFDTNGNNVFDDADGDAIVDASVSSGFGRHDAEPSGFIDMSEAWRDDNENNNYDSGEVFLDFNENQTFSAQDNLFNGPQCEGAKCATTNSLHVRKSLVLIMSGSKASYTLFDVNTLYNDSLNNISVNLPALTDGASQLLTFTFADLAGQALPVNTVINVSSSVGEINGTLDFTVPNTNQTGSLAFLITNPVGGDPEVGLVTITLTTPQGVITTLLKPLTLL